MLAIAPAEAVDTRHTADFDGEFLGQGAPSSLSAFNLPYEDARVGRSWDSPAATLPGLAQQRSGAHCGARFRPNPLAPVGDYQRLGLCDLIDNIDGEIANALLRWPVWQPRKN
jgi:hypothetical protein